MGGESKHLRKKPDPTTTMGEVTHDQIASITTASKFSSSFDSFSAKPSPSRHLRKSPTTEPTSATSSPPINAPITTSATADRHNNTSAFRPNPEAKMSVAIPSRRLRTDSSSSSTTATSTSYSGSESILASDDDDYDDDDSMFRRQVRQKEETASHQRTDDRIAALAQELSQAEATLDSLTSEWKHGEESSGKLNVVERISLEEEHHSLTHRLLTVEEEKDSLLDELEKFKTAARSSAAEAQGATAEAQTLREERDELRNMVSKLEAKVALDESESENVMEQVNLRNAELEVSLHLAEFDLNEATQRAYLREDELEQSLQAKMMETKELKGARTVESKNAEAKLSALESSFVASLRQRDDIIQQLRRDLEYTKKQHHRLKNPNVNAKIVSSPPSVGIGRSDAKRKDASSDRQADLTSKNARIQSLEKELANSQNKLSFNCRALHRAIMERDQARTMARRNWEQYKATKKLLQETDANLARVRTDLARCKRERRADVRRIQDLSDQLRLTQEESKRHKEDFIAMKQALTNKEEPDERESIRHREK